MKALIVSLLSLLICTFSLAQIKYVTHNGAGLKNGSSWANAWDSLGLGNNLYLQTAGTQVWIAGGKYYPLRDTSGVLLDGMNPYATFVIQKGVKIYGGFAGTESSINERVAAQIHGQNKTVLSGDLGIPNDNVDNVNVIVTMKQCGGGEVLDGVSIASSKGDGVDVRFTGSVTAIPIINNCEIRNNFPFEVSGIGIYGGIADAQIKILNSSFTDNRPGGAIRTNGCKLEVANCNFYRNYDEFTGASCINFYNTSGEVTNSTFFENSYYYSENYAIQLNAVTDSVYINNSIFWNNYSDTDVSNVNTASGLNLASVKNCLFQTQTVGIKPAVILNSFSADPLFINPSNPDGPNNTFGTADDGLSLSGSSPCIDKGRNEYINAAITSDVLGTPRVKRCRVDIGAYEYKDTIYIASGLYNGTAQTCTQYPVSNDNSTYIDTVSCSVLSSVSPNGANPVNGTVKVCVSNASTVQFLNGVPYVQRYYDITPSDNAANATARITLYYTQQDFNNFNAAAPTVPQLPTGPADAAGISHIIIEQQHGFSATGVPGTFNGTKVFIDPADNDIIWNEANEIWEVSFNVTGFSGFFMRPAAVVPVILVSFSGKENNGIVNLSWKTASEINAKYFDVQRSTDGRNFVSVINRPASRNANGSSYGIDDVQPNSGLNYYRLILVDNDGSKKYSNIIVINMKGSGKPEIAIAPNPAHTQSTLSISGNLKGKAFVILYDMNGRKISELYSGELDSRAFSTTFNVSNLNKGIYIIEVVIGNETTRKKVIVQ